MLAVGTISWSSSWACWSNVWSSSWTHDCSEEEDDEDDNDVRPSSTSSSSPSSKVASPLIIGGRVFVVAAADAVSRKLPLPTTTAADATCRPSTVVPSVRLVVVISRALNFDKCTLTSNLRRRSMTSSSLSAFDGDELMVEEKLKLQSCGSDG